MFSNWLIKLLFLFVIIFSISSNAQGQRETYVVELDSVVNLKKFILSNGYLDNASLINSVNDATEKSNKKLQDVAKFFEKIKPLSIRKFIRRLPEDVTYLTTASGKKFNIEGFQKLLVVETDTKIDANTLNDELKTNKTIKKITPDVKIDASTWPPNDPYYTYQLRTGNYFEYLTISQQIPFPPDSFGYSIKVLGDTVLENGKQYKILQFKDIIKYNNIYYKYERIDTLTGTVYRFNKKINSPEKEYMIDSLFAQLGDTINCSREGISSFGQFKTIFLSTYTDTIFGRLTTVKEFFDQSFIPGLHYKLAKGFGLINSLGCEFSCSATNLVYAIIDGQTYGKTITLIDKNSSTITSNYSLYQNYPNPFNSSTTITFDLPNSANVKLTIYNLLGEEIITLINEYKEAGSYKINWNAINLPSGIYLYRLETDNYTDSKKMTLLK